MPSDNIKSALLSAALTVGAALVGGYPLAAALQFAAITGAASFILQKLSPKPDVPDNAPPRTQVRSAIRPAHWVLGECSIGGMLSWIAVNNRDYTWWRY